MNPRNPVATTKSDTGSNPIEETESASEKEDIASSSRTEINPTVEAESAKEEQQDIASSSKTEINPDAETESAKEEQDVGSSSRTEINPTVETESAEEKEQVINFSTRIRTLMEEIKITTGKGDPVSPTKINEFMEEIKIATKMEDTASSSSKIPNPVGEKTQSATKMEDIASSSKIPNPAKKEDIASSSKIPKLLEEVEDFIIKENIGSSSKFPNRIGSSSSSLQAYAPSSRRTESLDIATTQDKFDEKTIVDPATKDTYFLEKFIGHYFNFRQCRVYKALYSQYSQDIHSYVTLKTISMNKNVNAFNVLRSQAAFSLANLPDAQVIRVQKTFGATQDLFCVSLPYMSEGPLLQILLNRRESRLPEDQISAVLKVVLLGLRDELHTDPIPMAHNTLNAGDIFVHIDNDTGEMSIRLAYGASVYHAEEIDNMRLATGSWRDDASSFLDPRTISQWGAAPEVYMDGNEDYSGPKSDIWLFGLTALDLAYGILPVKNREDLIYIIRKIREKRKLPKSLLRLVKKRKGKLKKVMDLVKPKKKRAFSVEFEEMVLACLNENPENRPTAAQLLNSPFFVTATERFKTFVLSGNNPGSAVTGAVEERRGN